MLLNGEKLTRQWLIYSESTKSVFCGPCRLFKQDNQFGNQGFNDWKNVKNRVQHHENSDEHKRCLWTLKIREKKYWNTQ